MANKILLADDSITIQKVVNLTFTDEGINVVTVGNGELALKKLNEEHFDLVLADIFMPGRNGYEVCEFVKRNPAMEGVPVILLVGAFEPFDKAEAARVQADGHLTKPFESRILIETVKRMLAEAAVLKAQSAVPSQDAGAGYRGQVVGWDVPTSPMVPITPQHLEEQEPEPPPYDPYASTAKLRPVHGVPPPVEEPAEQADNRTLGFGAPLPTGALFTSPGAELPPLEPPPGDGVPFEMPEPEPEPAEAPARAIEGPPDSVAGFSFNTGSGPLADTEAPVEERPSIGYQHIQPTDSPLDLPDMGVVEQHAHEPAVIDEVRDPLLETFADVSESTSSVDAAAAPGLEANVHADAPSSMHVGATEGLVSAWDNSAQAEAPAAPEPEPEPPAAESGAAVWQTQAFTAATPPPFAFSEEPQPTADLGGPPPFELPPEPEPEPPAAEEPPGSKPTLGLADLADLETIRSSSATERFTPEDYHAVASPTEPLDEQAPAVWEPEVEEEAPPAEQPVAEEAVAAAPETEAAALEEAAPEQAVAAPAAPAAPVNGSGGAQRAIPQEILDEVVRRTVERMNDDVIREIAWEVVPELAEQLIRKRLSENR